MPKATSNYDLFLKTAAELTGFTVGELTGTGQAKTYFEYFENQMEKDEFEEFIRYLSINKPEDVLNASYAELAQNIIWLFYFGQWKQVSDDAFGKHPEKNIDTIVSPKAFRSGLGWQAIGANPPGAKFPGFKSWTMRPRP